MNILFKWIITTIAIIASSYIVPGVEISGIWTAIWLAVILGLINIIIKPIIIILTLPINIITLGLFTFFINAFIILFASSIVKGFDVHGFWRAMLFSIILLIVSYILNKLIKED